MENIKRAKWLGVFGITICGLCCALPIVGAGLGMASLATIAFFLEKIGFTALALALIILLFAWYKRITKRRTAQTNSCSTSCQCKNQ